MVRSLVLWAIALSGCSWVVWAYEGCKPFARFLPSESDTNSSESKRNFEQVEVFYSDGSDFLITKRLGSGSYGEAYLGHNTTSNTPYVFKLYRFGKLQRKKMMREILVTQSVCGHPNIIKLQHVIKQTLTDYPILVFEYVKDTYYRDLYPKLTPEDVRFYMYKLFDAMAFAHERGVMHKDLKPANVMIDHDTHTLKVIDWGLSQFYVKDESQSIAGSMYYKSPEMLMDYGKSELSTDIWSMGCMFAAMLYQTDIFFVGDDEFDQVLTIAKVLGSKDLLAYNDKYEMGFNTTAITHEMPRQSWESLVTKKSKPFATADALHLLDHMLVYDHKKRISAKDALNHPYFRPLRGSSGDHSSTASSGGSAPSSTSATAGRAAEDDTASRRTQALGHKEVLLTRANRESAATAPPLPEDVVRLPVPTSTAQSLRGSPQIKFT